MINIKYLNYILNEVYFFMFFALFLSNLNILCCQGIGNGERPDLFIPPVFLFSLDDINYFNNILIFDNKKYHIVNSAMNNNGDLIIELSEDNITSSSKLFYGIAYDGRYFFPNRSSYTKEINIDITERNNEYRYCINNSLNMFVSIMDDNNINNQYLFSIDSYYSIVELYDLNSDNNIHYTWNFNNFFNLEENIYSFQYKYVIFELNEESTYCLALIPENNVRGDMNKEKFIIKFRFQSFDSDAYTEINSLKYKDYLNYKILNVFFMEDYYFFGVLFCIENEEYDKTHERQNTERRMEDYPKYIFNFYDENLEYFLSREIEFSHNLNGELLFFKSIYLGDGHVFFAYISNNQEYLMISSYEI